MKCSHQIKIESYDNKDQKINQTGHNQDPPAPAQKAEDPKQIPVAELNPTVAKPNPPFPKPNPPVAKPNPQVSKPCIKQE